MKWTKTHAVMVGVVIAGAAAISILQYRSQIRLSGQNDRLHQQAGQLAQLTTENQRLSNSVAQAHNSEATASNQSNGLLRQQIQEQPSVKSRNLSQPDVSPTPSISTKPEVAELSKDSWTNSGFATPQATLKTRGWAVLNGDRGQFAQSVFLTDGARKMIEDQLVQMASTSKDPDTPRLLGQAVSEKWGAEEAVLMPMMALNQNNAYTGYKILSQQSPSSDEMILNVETDMASALATTETLKFHRFGNDWRIVIDEAAVQKEMRQWNMTTKLAAPEEMLPLSPADLQILLALADEERHGYSIMQHVKEATDGQIKKGPGTLYGTVKRMLAAKLIEESDERPDPKLADERRRYYRLTPFGRRVLSAVVSRYARMVKAARAAGVATAGIIYGETA